MSVESAETIDWHFFASKGGFEFLCWVALRRVYSSTVGKRSYPAVAAGAGEHRRAAPEPPPGLAAPAARGKTSTLSLNLKKIFNQHIVDDR